LFANLTTLNDEPHDFYSSIFSKCIKLIVYTSINTPGTVAKQLVGGCVGSVMITAQRRDKRSFSMTQDLKEKTTGTHPPDQNVILYFSFRQRNNRGPRAWRLRHTQARKTSQPVEEGQNGRNAFCPFTKNRSRPAENDHGKKNQ
jgi:hypothetical protein